MAEIWAELCDSLSDELFISACKAAMRGSAYFPSPAIILRHAEIIREMRLEEQRRAMRALPYDEGPYTDADIDRIAGHCQRILESLEKRMRARQ